MNLDLDLDLVKSRTQTATHGHGEHTTHGRGHAKEGVGPNRSPGIQESANLLAACSMQVSAMADARQPR